jgi:hypothetical protein
MRELIRHWDLDKVITDKQLDSMEKEAVVLQKIAQVLKGVPPERRSAVLMASAVMSYTPPEEVMEDENE